MDVGYSRGWGHEWIGSLQFLGISFAIVVGAGALVALVLVLFTTVGRQFWQVNRGFFFGQRGRDAVIVWGTLALLTILLLGGIRVTYLLTYQSNDMYTAVQGAAEAFGNKNSAALRHARDVFWGSIRIFFYIVTFHVLRASFAYYVWYRFEVRWRSWLTEELADEWLHGDAAYRARFVPHRGDNPDQRIEYDVTNMVENSQTLIGGGVNAIASLAVFTQLLWQLSTPVSIWGVSVPRAMVFISFGYYVVSTVVTFVIGRPMIRWNFRYQRTTGDFRAQLVRTRISAEEVALARGGVAESARLVGMFRYVIHSFWRLSLQTVGVKTWSLATDQAAVLLPWIVQAKRFFAGDLTLGALTQTASAFQALQDSMSFFQDNYDKYSEYRSQLIRLAGLKETDVNADAVTLPPAGEPPEQMAVRLVDAGIDAPDGRPLLRGVNAEVLRGGSLLIQGPSGIGKSTLLRALAGLWPHVHGDIESRVPYVVTQTPYLPRGTMRDLLAYPAPANVITDEEARRVMVAVGLAERDLDQEIEDWSFLSPGERQRVVFARMLLARPDTIVLDEATSAVDAVTEAQMYDLLRSELPDSAVISVGHRQTLVGHHERVLELSPA